MKRAVLILFVTMLGVLFTAAPASAGVLDNNDGTLVAVDPEHGVTGETWSSPNQLVSCTEGGGIVNCRPVNSKDIKKEVCYTGVKSISHGVVTVCAATDDSDYKGLLTDSGGKPLEFKFGCAGFQDALCNMQEGMSGDFARASLGALQSASNAMGFTTSDLLWFTATTEWSFWAWAVLIVVLGCGITAIMMAMFSGENDQIIGAIVRMALTFPLIQFTLWITGSILNSLDTLGWYILTKGNEQSVFTDLVKVMFSDSSGQGFAAVLITGMLVLVSVLLIFVFTLRNIALAVLIMVGPIAFMLFPLKNVGREWVNRYISTVLTLMLTGPIVMGMLSFVLTGISNLPSLWDPRIWVFLIALLLVILAPFAVLSLFSFAGGVASDAIGSRMGSAGMSAGKKALRPAGKGAMSAARAAAKIPDALKRRAAGSGAQKAPFGGVGTGGGGAAGMTRTPAGTNASSRANATAGATRTPGNAATSAAGSSAAPVTQKPAGGSRTTTTAPTTAPAPREQSPTTPATPKPAGGSRTTTTAPTTAPAPREQSPAATASQGPQKPAGSAPSTPKARGGEPHTAGGTNQLSWGGK